MEPREKIVHVRNTPIDENRELIVDGIEAIVIRMLEQLSRNTFPKLGYAISKFDVVFEETQKSDQAQLGNNSGTTQDQKSGCTATCDQLQETSFSTQRSSWSTKTVDFKFKRSRNKMTLMLIVMARVHRLLITSDTRTRRSLYYELKSQETSHLVPNQRYLDHIVNEVASMLGRAPWELGLLATSKGLAFGDLQLVFKSGVTLNCFAPGGLLIPANVFDVVSMKSSANYVLVVEKDAIFQTLLNEDCPRLANCLLITGKGYPDVATRMLVRLLWKELQLPVYALMDADPFGFEIMCVYKFGSAIRFREQDKLACPGIRWLGIHPSELPALGVNVEVLTVADHGKLAALEKRNYVGEELTKELESMRRGKVEIEALSGFAPGFLTNVYLPSKIGGSQYH